eukprot:5350686-Pleurochrysis_carterae.AAC.2
MAATTVIHSDVNAHFAAIEVAIACALAARMGTVNSISLLENCASTPLVPISTEFPARALIDLISI